MIISVINMSTGAIADADLLRAIRAINRQIAEELHLSPKTVSRHLTNIFTKIQVTSRSAATAFAFKHYLVGRRP